MRLRIGPGDHFKEIHRISEGRYSVTTMIIMRYPYTANQLGVRFRYVFQETYAKILLSFHVESNFEGFKEYD